MKSPFVRFTQIVCVGLALAVNAGSSWAQQGPHTVRYTVTDLGTLGGTYSFGYGINNHGVVAGGAATPAQTNFVSQTAFLSYGGASPISLGTLGGTDCPDCSSEAGGPNAYGVSALLSETSGKDKNNEDFCAFGTHHPCLAAIWKSGLLTALPLLQGGNNSQTYWINDLGEAVGFSETGTYDSSCSNVTPYQVLQFKSVVWGPDGNVRELSPLPGDTVSFALGINNRGQAVGVSGLCSNTTVPPISPASSAPHAVLWDRDGSPTDLGSLVQGGSSFNVPASINDRGEVVGASLASDGTIHPFVWTKESGMQDLGEPTGAFVTGIPCCHTINNEGQVVGFSVGASGPHAFLWEHGDMTDLNALIPADSGWVLQFADSINDRGGIVGFGVNPNGETHGFLVRPVGFRGRE